MFIVLETQTHADGTVGVIPTAYTNENEAHSKYHAILSAAAVSSIPKHTAFMLTDDGYVLESRCFKHEQEVADEGQTEGNI